MRWEWNIPISNGVHASSIRVHFPAIGMLDDPGVQTFSLHMGGTFDAADPRWAPNYQL